MPTESPPVCFTESLYNYEEQDLVSPGYNYQGLPGISTLRDDNGIILPRLRPGASLRQLGPRRGPAFVLMCIFICSDINNHVSIDPRPIVANNRRVAGDVMVLLLQGHHVETRYCDNQ